MKTVLCVFLLFLAIAHGVDVLEDDLQVSKRRGLLVALSIIVGAVIGGAVTAIVGSVTTAGIDACGGGRRIVVVVEDGQGNVIGRGRGRRQLSEQEVGPVSSGENGAGTTPSLSEDWIKAPNGYWENHLEAKSVISYAEAKRMVTPGDEYGQNWDPTHNYIIPMQITAIDANTGDLTLRVPAGSDWFDESKWEQALQRAASNVDNKVDLSLIAPAGWTPPSSRKKQKTSPGNSDANIQVIQRQSMEISEANSNTETDILPAAAIVVASFALVLVFYRMCMGRKTNEQYSQLIAEIDEL